MLSENEETIAVNMLLLHDNLKQYNNKPEVVIEDMVEAERELNYLTELFPNVELIENTYDGGIQLFFYPVDNRFDFTAVACEIFTDFKNLDELTDMNINSISFMFKPNKLKTRAGNIMTE